MGLPDLIAARDDGTLNVVYNSDGSYVVVRSSGLPCQVVPSYDPELYAALESYRLASPGAVLVLPPPAGPTLATLITAKAAATQAAKVSARDAGFEVGGTHFDSDAAARISYRELADILRADPAYATPWRASPGAWVTMDAALYAQVQTAGAAHLRSVFAWQAARDAELAAIQAAVAAGTMSETDAREAVAAVSTTYEATP